MGTESDHRWAEFGKKICLIMASALLGLLMAWPLKWCWNTVMPYLFEFPMLTWGKAWCLYFISILIWRPAIIHSHPDSMFKK